MSGNESRAATLRIVNAVLTADCACATSDLTNDGVLITHAEERAGRRRFPPPAKPLLIVTMGAGVVVACHPNRADWLRATLGPLPRDAIFEAATIAKLARWLAADDQELRGPDIKYVCAPATFRPAADPLGVAITVVEGDEVDALRRHEGFGHALSNHRNNLRPDVAAAIATRERTIVGIAAASADCDALWQIGIDVIHAERGRGIGRALVGRLTELAFRHRQIPYYTTAVSNIRSGALAIGLGYWPAWSELRAKDLTPVSRPDDLSEPQAQQASMRPRPLSLRTQSPA